MRHQVASAFGMRRRILWQLEFATLDARHVQSISRSQRAPRRRDLTATNADVSWNGGEAHVGASAINLLIVETVEIFISWGLLVNGSEPALS